MTDDLRLLARLCCPFATEEEARGRQGAVFDDRPEDREEPSAHQISTVQRHRTAVDGSGHSSEPRQTPANRESPL